MEPAKPVIAPIVGPEPENPENPVQPVQPAEPTQQYGQAGVPLTPPGWRPGTPNAGGSYDVKDPWANNDPGSGLENPWAPRTGGSPPRVDGGEPRNMDDEFRNQQGDPDGLEDDDDDEDRRKRLPSLKQSPKFAPHALYGRLDANSASSLSTVATAISSVSAASHPSTSPVDLASPRSSLVVPLPSSPLAGSTTPASRSPTAILPSAVTTALATSRSSAADQQPSFAPAPQEPTPALPVNENVPKVVARVVATWKAPVDGGIAGRLDGYDELASESPSRRLGHGKFRRGNRRRDLPDQVPSKSSREAYIKASREGKSCCANAVWYD
jgi:hypothetical protein